MPPPPVTRHPHHVVPPARTARVADAMSAGVVSCSRDTPLREVADLMISRRTHAVAVDGIRRTPTGDQVCWSLLTALDLVGCVRHDADRLRARDVPGGEVLTVTPETSLAHAAELMARHHVTHLLVVSPHSGLPAGVVSAIDLVRTIAWGGLE